MQKNGQKESILKTKFTAKTLQIEYVFKIKTNILHFVNFKWKVIFVSYEPKYKQSYNHD